MAIMRSFECFLTMLMAIKLVKTTTNIASGRENSVSVARIVSGIGSAFHKENINANKTKL